MHEIGRVNSIGTTARKHLARRDCVGRVLAVVTDAVYLQTRSHSLKENGGLGSEILWLTQNSVPMHPRAIRGDFDLTLLREEMGVTCDSREVRFVMRGRAELRLDFADAPVWMPHAISPGRVLHRDMAAQRAGELRSTIKLQMPLTPAADPISRIERACRDGDLAHALQAGRKLVGLGPGLTPSGDDFLGGLLFAAQHLHVAYPGAFDWNQQSIDDWLDWAHSRTSSISYAILRDHASGRGVEPLHRLVAGLILGRATSEMMQDVRALLAIGSTSGRDMLVGAMTGLLLIAGTHQTRDGHFLSTGGNPRNSPYS